MGRFWIRKSLPSYSRAPALFDQVLDESNPINTVMASDIARKDFDFGGFVSTKVRMALALGGLRLLDGRREEASAFAGIGFDNLGSASTMRAPPEALLPR
jgi:hypothetical protein